MKKIIFVLLIACIAMYSCKKRSQKQFTITGEIVDLKDSHIYLHYRDSGVSHWDSAKITNGRFIFDASVSYPKMAAFYLINKDTNNIAKFRVKIPFFLENADITVKGNIDSLKRLKFSGSQSQSEYEVYQASIAGIKAKRKVLWPKYRRAKENKDSVALRAFEVQYDELALQEKTQTKKFINSHPKSFVSLYELSNLVYNTPYADLQKLYFGLDTSLKCSTKGKALGDKLNVMKRSAIGQPAPLFTMNDVTGNAVNLSDYKGKYVLLDFWASWCGPCRAENPNLVKMYNKYKQEGFDVLGVSLDDDKTKWLQAIKGDHLTWIQVSDLQGWKNKAAKMYGVHAIPANYLIGPDGKVLARNLRGSDLRDKLKDIFN